MSTIDSKKIIFRSKNSVFFTKLFYYIEEYDFQSIYIQTIEDNICISGYKDGEYYTFKIYKDLFEEYINYGISICIKTDTFKIFLENICNTPFLQFSLFLDDNYQDLLGVSFESNSIHKVFYLKTIYIATKIELFDSNKMVSLKNDNDIISLFENLVI